MILNHRIFAEAGIADLILTGAIVVLQSMVTSPAIPLHLFCTKQARPGVQDVLPNCHRFKWVGVGAGGLPLKHLCPV